MKIIVKQGETEIVVDESNNSIDTKRFASIRWEDEKKRVLSVLSEMVNHVKELNK